MRLQATSLFLTCVFSLFSLLELHIFPSIPSYSGASLSLRLALNSTTETFELTVISPYEFIPKVKRKDCYWGLSGIVNSEDCWTTATQLNVILRDCSGEVNITVGNAFNLPINSATASFAVVLNASEPVLSHPVALYQPTTALGNLEAAISETEGLETVLSVRIPIETPQNAAIRILFPLEFALNRDSAHPKRCESMPASPLICAFSASAIHIHCSNSLASSTVLEIYGVSLPQYLLASSQITAFIVKDETILAYGRSVPIVMKSGFNLFCCFPDIWLSPCFQRTACLALRLNQAQFSASRSAVIAYFQGPMDTSDSEDQACERLMTVSTVQRLGHGAKCQWLGSDQLWVELGQYYDRNNDVLAFSEGTIRYFGLGEALIPAEIRISPSHSPLPLKAVIYSKGVISDCTSAEFDCLSSRGAGKNDLTCEWWANGVSLSTEKYIRVSDKEVKLGRKEGILVSLRVRNVWGEVDTVSKSFHLTLDHMEVAVEFEFGNYVEFTYSSEFSFVPVIYPLLRDFTGIGLTQVRVEWHSNATVVDTQCKQTRICRISPRSAPAGLYWLQADVVLSIGPDKTISGWISVFFRVVPSPISLSIVGGSRVVAANADLQIDGSRTTDPDTGLSLLLLWSVVELCQSRAQYCDVRTRVLTIPAGTLEVGKRYTILVTPVTDSERMPIPTETVWINVTDTPPFRTRISTPTRVNPSEVFTIHPLSITASDLSQCIWSQTTKYRYFSLSIPTSPFLAFAAESLLEGQTYVFQYICSEIITEVEFTVNYGPEGGLFLIEPSAGTELDTVFSLLAVAWLDTDNDYPLFYQFSSRNLSENREIPLTPVILEANFSTILLKMNQNRSETITLSVCDSLRTCKKVHQNVKISALSDAISQIHMEKLLFSYDFLGLTPSNMNFYLTKLSFIALALKNRTKIEENPAKTATDVILSTLTDPFTIAYLSNFSTENQYFVCSVLENIIHDGVISESQTIFAIQSIFTRISLKAVNIAVISCHLRVISAGIRLVLAEPDRNIYEKWADLLFESLHSLKSAVISVLSPGQTAVNISSSEITLFAYRSFADSFTDSDYAFAVHLANTTHVYRLSLGRDIAAHSDRAATEVIDIGLTISQLPPRGYFPVSLYQQLCTVSYSFGLQAETCYLLSLQLPLSIYPSLEIQVSDALSSQIDSTALQYGMEIEHTIPIADMSRGIRCCPECVQSYYSEAEIRCKCPLETELYLERDSAISAFVVNTHSNVYDEEGTLGMKWAGLIAVGMIVLWVGVWSWMREMDRKDEPRRVELAWTFHSLLAEFVLEALHHCSQVSPSVPSLDFLFSSGSDADLRTALRAATFSLPAHVPKWSHNGVLSLVRWLLPQPSFLRLLRSVHIQLSLGVRYVCLSNSPQSHSSLALPLDDLLSKRTAYYRVMAGHPLVGLFSVIKMRVGRGERALVLGGVGVLLQMCCLMDWERHRYQHRLVSLKDMAGELGWGTDRGKMVLYISIIFSLILYHIEDILAGHLPPHSNLSLPASFPPRHPSLLALLSLCISTVPYLLIAVPTQLLFLQLTDCAAVELMAVLLDLGFSLSLSIVIWLPALIAVDYVSGIGRKYWLRSRLLRRCWSGVIQRRRTKAKSRTDTVLEKPEEMDMFDFKVKGTPVTFIEYLDETEQESFSLE